MRTGSSPDFAPPVQEGMVFTFEDEDGEHVDLEFLGLVLRDGVRYGFFFPITESQPALGSGEVMVLEVTSLDDEGQPDGFEIVDDEAVASDAYAAFKAATSDLYDFSD